MIEDLIREAVEDKIKSHGRTLSKTREIYERVELTRYIVENKLYENIPQNLIDEANDDEYFEKLKAKIDRLNLEINRLKEFLETGE